MEIRRNWSWEEILMAFALYFLLDPKHIDGKQRDVSALAHAIGRTPSSVALKIANISAHDANRLAEGKVGLSHGSKFDSMIWDSYSEEGDALLETALNLLRETLQADNTRVVSLEYVTIGLQDIPEGKEKMALVKQRVNQQYFRKTLLENYLHKCCITGLSVDQLLIASHIKPWEKSNPLERLAASNGLLLNALHDRAFDKGLITIDQEFKLHVSRNVKRTPETSQWLWSFEGKEIYTPPTNKPGKQFIEYHNDCIFNRST